jgi:hypothetical protein
MMSNLWYLRHKFENLTKKGNILKTYQKLMATISIGLILIGAPLAHAGLGSYITGATPVPPLQHFVSGGTETLAEAGLQNPETLWVSAQYTGSSNALYIKGNRYSAPGGFNDVRGFIKTDTGYLVAVYQNQITVVQTPVASAVPATAAPGGLSTQQTQLLQQQMKKIQAMPGLSADQRMQMVNLLMQSAVASADAAPSARPVQAVPQVAAAVQAGAGIVFYSVDHKGETLGTMGSLATVSDCWVLVTPTSIYVSQPAGQEGGLRLSNYVGIDATGKQLTGPQNVVFASPAPDGGWYTVQLGQLQNPQMLYATYQRIFAHIDPQGVRTPEFTDQVQYGTPDYFGHTMPVFVNMPPVVDSYRTGHVVRIGHNGPNGLQTTGFTWQGAIFNLAKAPPIICHGLIGRECDPQWGDYSFALGTTADIPGGLTLMEAIRAAQGLILFGTVADPQVAAQLTNGAGLANALNYGTVNVATKGSTAVFSIMGAGLNTFRSLLGANTNSTDLSEKNDAYAILTPTGLLIANANAQNQDKPQMGFDLTTQKTLAAGDVSGFLTQFGITY